MAVATLVEMHHYMLHLLVYSIRFIFTVPVQSSEVHYSKRRSLKTAVCYVSLVILVNFVTALAVYANVTAIELRLINTLLQTVAGYLTDVLGDAKLCSSHANKKSIDLDDIKMAIQFKLDHSYTNPPPRDVCSFRLPLNCCNDIQGESKKVPPPTTFKDIFAWAESFCIKFYTFIGIIYIQVCVPIFVYLC